MDFQLLFSMPCKIDVIVEHLAYTLHSDAETQVGPICIQRWAKNA